MSNEKPLHLQAIYFIPGVAIVSGVTNYPSSLSHWSAEKHPLIKCEEQKNGDCWFTTPNGTRREVSALVIASRTRTPDVIKPADPVRRNVEQVKQ
jgi:hypothetical protein